jgi:pre-rRNA-processing protein TSR3
MTPDSTFPPSIIIVHEKERRDKCSVEPLRGRSDFLFHRFPLRGAVDATGYVRLALEGKPLSLEDRDRGLLVLDATWRLAGKMESAFFDVEPRTLPPWDTAYPRQSKMTPDPAQGLATIEAIFVAYKILQRDTSGLLDAYHWRDEFLRRNQGKSIIASPGRDRDRSESPRRD